MGYLKKICMYYCISMSNAYLLIGGNTGDRTGYLLQARTLIQERLGYLTKASGIYETAAWGNTNQDDFLNQVVGVETNLSCEGLMAEILNIEEDMGRVRTEKNAPRIIEIDILFYNDEIINEPHLHIPHPEIQNRRFVLIPLAEIAPDFIHPVFKSSVNTLLSECKDPLDVRLFKEQ